MFFEIVDQNCCVKKIESVQSLGSVQAVDASLEEKQWQWPTPKSSGPKSLFSEVPGYIIQHLTVVSSDSRRGTHCMFLL